LKNNTSLYVSPFIYYFFKKNFTREDIDNRESNNYELVYGLGLKVNNIEKPSYKINMLSNIKILDKLDFSAKLKYNRLSLNKMSESIENILDKEVSL